MKNSLRTKEVLYFPLVELEAYSTFFDRWIPVVDDAESWTPIVTEFGDDQPDILEDSYAKWIEECVEVFNSLSMEDLDRISKGFILECRDVEKETGHTWGSFKGNFSGLRATDPQALWIGKPRKDSIPAVIYEANCSWDEEHGTSFVLYGDKIIYLGQFESFDLNHDNLEEHIGDLRNYASKI